MNIIFGNKESNDLSNQISISLIKQIIEKLLNENNNYSYEIKIDIIEILERLDCLYQKREIQEFFDNKLRKYSKYIGSLQNIILKNYDDKDENKLKNSAIFFISIFFLRRNINCGNHVKIKKYLKLLVNSFLLGEISINNFFFILEIMILSIIEILKQKSLNEYKIFDINDEPLSFIIDVIETIIKYPIELMKNEDFIKNLIDIFNKFFENIEKINIIIREDVIWLKLLEVNTVNDAFELLDDESYQKSIQKIKDLLSNIYKKNIAKKFYDSIYKQSSIDLIYYMNIINLLKETIKNDLEKQKKLYWNKGVYLLGTNYTKENFNFSSNEFSIILSFQIINNKNNEISLFHLIQKEKDKNDNIIHLFIKDNLLNLNIMKDKWNTNIIIEKNIMYFICMECDKKTKEIQLYINNEKIFEEKTKDKRYTTKINNFPKFGKDMEVVIGDNNLYSIYGDIFFLNKGLDIAYVKLLFNTKGLYSDLLIRNNINTDLVKNINYSDNYKKMIEAFKNLKYEYYLIFSPNLLLYNENISKNLVKEYINTNNYNEFINSNGFEFLIFMLHNIKSRVTDIKLLNKYIYIIIDFLSTLLDRETNKGDDYWYELDKDYLINNLNIFFMTLLSILKPEKDEEKKFIRTLSDEIWEGLLKIFYFELENSNVYKQIILSIILDSELFELNKFLPQLNDSVDKFSMAIINNELIYKILLIDFIFESDDINHKSYLNLINSLILSKNEYFCKSIINYIIKIKSEKKAYHYLKVIYRNIKALKQYMQSDILCLYEYCEIKFKTVNTFHCRYCSYIIILCYLLKQDIMLDKEENREDNFNFDKLGVGYMANPSFLFILSIFIENFNLENKYKLTFIKTKGKKSEFNFDIFRTVKYHPFELYDPEKFLVRFNSILKYIEYLMSLEQNDNLKEVIAKFFSFILLFGEKIKKRYSDNVFIKEDDEKFANIFYSSNGFTDFFILYIKYDKKEAMKYIKKFINVTFYKFNNCFYYKLLRKKCIIIDENNSINIKLDIMKSITGTIINYKEKLTIDNRNNIYLFLILLHENIFQDKIRQIKLDDFSELFSRLQTFLLDKNLILFDNLIDLEYFDYEEEEDEDEQENQDKINNDINNKKFVCEIILDIFFKFHSMGYCKKEMLSSFLIQKNSTSYFYQKDNEIIHSKKQKVENDESDDDQEIFKDSVEDFSFCLYFLIYFFEKDSKCKDQNQKSNIKIILETIFNDLKTIYILNKKVNSILKKIKHYGKKFSVYNEMLDICNKSFKDSNFTLEFLNEKYNQIINNIEKEKENKNKLNDSQNKNNKENENKEEQENNEKNKNSEINEKINEEVKEEYIKNNEIKNDINNKILNNELDNEKKEDHSNNIKEDIKKEEITTSGDVIIKQKFSQINIIDFYIKIVLGDDYRKDTTNILFNPKQNYIWNKFTFIFKDFIFFNKKFKDVSKLFKIHIGNPLYYGNHMIKNEENFYLNYPTKLRNYTTDEYYRPFLKPYLNFFNNKLVNVSHNYLKKNFLKNMKYKEENFNTIKYKKLIPDLNKEKYFCELFKNKGNIFGYIELNNNCIVFKNSPDDDIRSSKDHEKSFQFIFSIIDDKIIDNDKYILLFYSDIKEIIKRRICLLYIGIEIFMKDNKSYMFNFFDKNAINKFFEEIKKYIYDNNKLYKINTVKEENLKNSKININNPYNLNNQYQNKSEINLKLIEDPISEFKKLNLKSKNKKGELSNFDYLLQINKYSSRTYNDSNQYLIFPLLFLDVERKRRRDLSKVICLNKLNCKSSLEKAQNNYNFFKYHFNQHYSTGGFIYYYLVRLIPFTYQHIIFQSMKFDVPTRLFSSLNNTFLFYEVTDDNRELIPEFFSSHEFLINLNYNDFGLLETSEESYYINNVDTHCKFAFPEFIIKSRNSLEEADISPWIDYIFGAKQTTYCAELPSLFSPNTYEEFSKLEKIKEENISLEEKRNKILENIDILKFGVTPAKVFNRQHDKMGNNNLDKNEDDVINFSKKEEKCINVINKYIQKKMKEKVNYFFINNKNDKEIEIIFKFNTKIDIFKLKFGDMKNIEITLKIQEQIDFKPYENSLCEIFPETYCTVRHIDNTISFTSSKKALSRYQFSYLVTSVEIKYNKYLEDKNYKEIFIGDEKGILHLIEIRYEYNQNEKSFEIKELKRKKSVKTHERYIKGLLHYERLNAIFSWSDENDGYICINNDYTLDFLNIIKLGRNKEIDEIKISKYDLIFVSYYDKLDKLDKKYAVNCYSLNGLNISNFASPQKIVKCFLDEKINMVFGNKNGFSFKLYAFDDKCESFYLDFKDVDKSWQIKINDCQYYPQIKNYLMIRSDYKAYFFENKEEYI